ncbi:hypothetical protein MNBD_GAMMA01-472 [hydrothermal vent metagenome]|uniref:DUF7088 domain-containing protein n=1 Tax=hydrothermal vent metagenome TaxID=652676 RepID=A0A3B0UR91_9ZZZZ
MLLLVCAISLFMVFIYFEKYNIKYSYKINQDQGLSEQSTNLIQNLSDAVKFEVYTNKDTAIAKKIHSFFQPFKRINNSKIQIKFTDPVTNPDKIRANAITMQGEILLTYVDANKIGKINITELSESAVINAILRLQNNSDDWLVIAEGYGMASITDETASGLSGLLIHLKKIGLNVARMPLNPSLVLPDNVKIIILPMPTAILDAEIAAWLEQQSEQGISIWWLNDTGTASQVNLELIFDIMFADKTILADDKFSAIISKFPAHVITEKFNQPIYIAQALEIITENAQVLMQAQNNNTIAVAKQLEHSRVIITGDADFITNQYLNTAANKSMVVRMLDWLFYNDARINIPLQVNKNTQLFLTQIQLVIISILFLLLIPVFFIVIAIRQHRARHG